MLQCVCQKLAYEKQGQRHETRKEETAEALWCILSNEFSGTKDKQQGVLDKSVQVNSFVAASAIMNQ